MHEDVFGGIRIVEWCIKCILPDTRPNLVLDQKGVCNACRSHSTKDSIDWKGREKAFRDVALHAKARSKGYDCLIPVSGGKDSTWQVVMCLRYGLNPLAVTWKTPARTAIGIRNLQNLINLGVDHIDYQINPNVEKKFMYLALRRYGSTAIPMHLALFNIPLKIAVEFEIPLVVWGENSAFEYGTSDEERKGFKLDSSWLKIYGVSHGTTAGDWICDELSAKELTPYFGPTVGEIEEKGILAVFLGYYFKWDPELTRKVACEHGFRPCDEGPKTGFYDFADIDDEFISIHHYLKWYKFGFTRVFDNLSLEIRNGRITRGEAIEIIRNTGDQIPDEDIEKFCSFVSITKDHFYEVIEKFRNKDIWEKRDRKWVIKDFLIVDWRWHEIY